MSGPLLGPEGAPIIAGEDDDPNDDSERCEECGNGLDGDRMCRDVDCMEASMRKLPDIRPILHHSPCGGIPEIVMYGTTIPSPAPDHCPHCGNKTPCRDTVCGMYRPVTLPTVATPDGVFVGDALAAHERNTKAIRPPRVMSAAGRVQREIALMGVLAEIVAAWDTHERNLNDGNAWDDLADTVRRARALLAEGSER